MLNGLDPDNYTLVSRYFLMSYCAENLIMVSDFCTAFYLLRIVQYLYWFLCSLLYILQSWSTSKRDLVQITFPVISLSFKYIKKIHLILQLQIDSKKAAKKYIAFWSHAKKLITSFDMQSYSLEWNQKWLNVSSSYVLFKRIMLYDI